MPVIGAERTPDHPGRAVNDLDRHETLIGRPSQYPASISTAAAGRKRRAAPEYFGEQGAWPAPSSVGPGELRADLEVHSGMPERVHFVESD
jgi:hypothetical protein